MSNAADSCCRVDFLFDLSCVMAKKKRQISKLATVCRQFIFESVVVIFLSNIGRSPIAQCLLHPSQVHSLLYDLQTSSRRDFTDKWDSLLNQGIKALGIITDGNDGCNRFN